MEAIPSQYHKKRRKGARSKIDRRKNCDRLRSQAGKTNPPTNFLPTSLPNQWQVHADESSTEYYKIMHDTTIQVGPSVIIRQDYSWDVFLYKRKISQTSPALSRFPPLLTSSDTVIDLIHSVDELTICPGNPEETFINVCKKKGGSVKGKRGFGPTVGYIDNTQTCTVRSTNCDIISTNTMRCKSCSSLRSTLKSSISRQKDENNEDCTAADSHTTYSNLSSEQKDTRLRNLHLSLKSARQQNTVLKAKIAGLIQDQAVPLQAEDATDIGAIMRDVQPLVEANFPSNTPQRIFWEQQVLYNGLKDKRQMRWHPLLVRFALNLKYLSTSAYKAMRQSGIISLPSERTLSDYTHWSTPHNGVQLEFIEEFIRMLDTAPCNQNHCTLSMDEMKIKSGLVFNKHSGTLVGFIDLGRANHDIELLVSGKNVGKQLADHVFVFMARSVFKPSLSVPIAHYFSLNLKGIPIFLTHTAIQL